VEPFKITCVSCRAVLTVRKESMIGQIIACPRCSMMVQVSPPAGHGSPTGKPAGAAPTASLNQSQSGARVKAAGAAAGSAASLFESADALADVALPSAPPAPSAPSDPIFAATFDDAVESLHEPVASAATPTLPPATVSSAPVPPPPPTHLPPVPSHWATLKLPALIVGGGLAGAALVATALTLFTGEEPAPTVATNSNAAPVVAVAQPAETAPVETKDTPTVPAKAASVDAAESSSASADAPLAVDANVDAVPEIPVAESPLENPTEASDQPAAPAAGEAPSIADAETPAPDAAADAPPTPDDSAPAKTAADDGPKLRIDPLELDPEGLNLTTLYNGPPKDPIAESQLPGEPAGAELSVPAPHAAPADGAPSADDEPNTRNVVRRDEQAVGAPGANVAALLARKTPELKIQNMPLCRLLDLSVQMSGVPVSVAPDQLRLAAVSAGQPATADVKDATIEEFLTAALKPLRLQPVVVNDQIALVRGTNNPRRTVAYAVDDLAADADAVEQLAATIQKVVAPESWESAGGSGTIAVDGKQFKIETGEAIQYEVLLLLERSRAALGLPHRSKYPAALVGADAAPIALTERLSAPATFTFLQYTPLREIFRHWQEEMEVAVLVDWPALTDLRLWPNTRIACSSSDKSWEKALDEVLTPLGLAWRPIDKRTIEITSLEKANSAPLVEIYRLNPDALAAVENLAGELDQVAAAAGASASEMANVLLEEHSVLIARQPATGQRAIADYLAGKGLLATK